MVLALGVRGGVPDKAADVPLADHLEHLFPEMSQQVRSPPMLLLSSRRRPRRVKRGYTWLASTYPELVRKNVKAGLHKLKHPHQVARHRGKPVVAGAFAVVKDGVEDRVITDPQVNQLLDPDRLPRPKFAFHSFAERGHSTSWWGAGCLQEGCPALLPSTAHRPKMGPLVMRSCSGPSCAYRRDAQDVSSMSVHSHGVWAISRVGSGSNRCCGA